MVVDRRMFIGRLAGGVLAWPLAAGAQTTGTVYRVGYLAASSVSPVEAFREGLRELGWAEGRNIAIDYRSADGRFERLPDLATELVRLKVGVIVAAGGTTVAVAAKKATGTIPIVMTGAGDPVEQGLVASLARPSGNVTGVSFSVGTETLGKQLELLTETVPKAHRVAVLTNPANPARALALNTVKATARSLGVQLQPLDARGPNQFDRAFGAMAQNRVDALIVVADPMFSLHRTQLGELSAKNRLPAIYGYREHVEAGGLMSYGASLPEIFRRAAVFVDKILKGVTPADLPVEQPTKFELVINLKTAKTLGLTIPPSLLQRADQVIE